MYISILLTLNIGPRRLTRKKFHTHNNNYLIDSNPNNFINSYNHIF